VSHTCEATFGVPGRGGKGRGGARESRKRGVATDARGLHMAGRLVRVLPEIAAWAATLPNDILLLEPWLMPLRADAAGAAGERALNH
jgi:hypothetical protein